MTYQEARNFIDQSNQNGSKLGLDTIKELLYRLDQPQEKLRLIHVAGTNGKGSTTAMIASILKEEGYKVGRYISPAVFSYEESIQIGTDYITEEAICETIDRIKPICEAMVGEGLNHPTSFEIETAMAFCYFAAEQVDFAVIEVGLGGRLDATNVIQNPICCVITSISMDHMQFLGDTLEQIAREKCGIIKNGVPVITGNTKPEVMKVILNTCIQRQAQLYLATNDSNNTIFSPESTKFQLEGKDYKIGLLGEYQVDNAVLAIRTVQALQESGISISEKSVTSGLYKARWKGRFEIVEKDPYFIIDGAHNEEAALQLKNILQKLFPTQRLIFILGVLADKDYHKILSITAPLAATIITLTPNNSRALSSKDLAKEAANYTSAEIIDAGTADRAVEIAYKKTGKDDVILAFGSLSYLGEIVDCIRK